MSFCCCFALEPSVAMACVQQQTALSAECRVLHDVLAVSTVVRVCNELHACMCARLPRQLTCENAILCTCPARWLAWQQLEQIGGNIPPWMVTGRPCRNFRRSTQEAAGKPSTAAWSADECTRRILQRQRPKGSCVWLQL